MKIFCFLMMMASRSQLGETRRLEKVALAAARNGDIHLPWKSGPLWGAPGGTLGVQVEVSLPVESWMDFGKKKLLGANVNKISQGIADQLNETGIDADIIMNQCKCFIRYDVPFVRTPDDPAAVSILPFLINVNGVSDYEKFGRSQLESVTSGLFEQLSTGVEVPEGARFAVATDGDGNPIRHLKQEIEENPALAGAVETVALNRIENHIYNGMPFSAQQFLLEIEVDKYAVITNNVGGWSAVASAAGKLGAGTSQQIVNTIYGLLAGQLVDKVAENGINILISSPAFASKYFSQIGPLSAGNALALHSGTRSVRSVIPIDDPDDPLDFVNLKKRFPKGLPNGKVPESIHMWKRRVNGDGKKLTGFRLVMTVTSVNKRFQITKLPVLRDGVAGTLKKALAETLRTGTVSFNATVSVAGCGWKPPLESEPPYPHDEGGCAEPPNSAK